MENNENKMITITMEEYKELLITKGKYEALKESLTKSQPIIFREPTYSGDWKPDLSKNPTITFNKEVSA